MEVPGQPDDLTLFDLLERVINKGVVVQGDIVISLADIDLLYVNLRLLIASVAKLETVSGQRFRLDGGSPTKPGDDPA